MSLFNIEAEYLDIISQIEEAEGELTPELEERLAINLENLEAKLKAYNYVISMIKGEIVVIDDEVSRLRALKEVKENLIDRLRKAILQATMLFGEDGKTGNKKLKFDTLQTWTVNKEVVVIDENKILDPGYSRASITNSITMDEAEAIKKIKPDATFVYSPDKKKLMDDLKLGVELKAARLEIKPYVVIK